MHNDKRPRKGIPAYIFGSARAGHTQQRKAGTDRKPSALPTSVAELNVLLPKVRVPRVKKITAPAE